MLRKIATHENTKYQQTGLALFSKRYVRGFTSINMHSNSPPCHSVMPRILYAPCQFKFKKFPPL
jgi:hypothetical protein